MANFSATDNLAYDGATLTPGVQFTVWDTDATVFDSNSDDNIDSTDYLHLPQILYTGQTVTINGNNYAVFYFPAIPRFYVPYNSAFDDLSQHTDSSTWTFNTVPENAVVANCFLSGTLIATPAGEVAVETLQAGDLIRTADGRDVPVKWLARQTLRSIAVNMPHPEQHEPVCISAGALGNGLPHSDLYLTADHGLMIDGLVVNASVLVNGSTIRYVPAAELPRDFAVYHIETAAHDEILANGAAVETYIDYLGRKGFDNYDDYLALNGADSIIPELRRPRVSALRLLPEPLQARFGVALAEDLAA